MRLKLLNQKIVVVGKPINYTGDIVFNFDYTGAEQTFIAPVSGTYKLETWGAQGGNAYHSGVTFNGGYGAYLLGNTKLNHNAILYLNVGGAGKDSVDSSVGYDGGYNGGGYGQPVQLKDCYNASGGGATHISKNSGLLSTLTNKLDYIYIVSGGGGGAGKHAKFEVGDEYGYGGNAGGIVGNAGSAVAGNYLLYDAGTGGTQTQGGTNATTNIIGTFGHGANGSLISVGWKGGSGGGSGFYGGGTGYTNSGAGGGSSYIGNSLLTNKVMYCYNCEESSEESTKTISTNCVEETPTENCAKKGNGYARITLVSIDE